MHDPAIPLDMVNYLTDGSSLVPSGDVDVTNGFVGSGIVAVANYPYWGAQSQDTTKGIRLWDTATTGHLDCYLLTAGYAYFTSNVTTVIGSGTNLNIQLDPGGTGIVEVIGSMTVNNGYALTARINPRVKAWSSGTTITIASDTTDQYNAVGITAGMTFAEPSGTPVDGQKLTIRIEDDGTGRALTWNAIFRAIGVTLPVTTTATKLIYVGLVYNSTDTKWDAVAVAEEA